MSWGAGASRQLECPSGEIVVCDLSIIENAEIFYVSVANLRILDDQSAEPSKIMPSSGHTLCTQLSYVVEGNHKQAGGVEERGIHFTWPADASFVPVAYLPG